MSAAEPFAVGCIAPSTVERTIVPITKEVLQSVTEALKEIDEGEREFEHGETFSHREIMQMVWGKIEAYAG